MFRRDRIICEQHTQSAPSPRSYGEREPPASVPRIVLFLSLLGVAMLSFAASALAQTPDDYPNRPIRIIVPQAAGSGVDLQARVLAQKMSGLWGQIGVVENR